MFEYMDGIVDAVKELGQAAVNELSVLLWGIDEERVK